MSCSITVNVIFDDTSKMIELRPDECISDIFLKINNPTNKIWANIIYDGKILDPSSKIEETELKDLSEVHIEDSEDYKLWMSHVKDGIFSPLEKSEIPKIDDKVMKYLVDIPSSEDKEKTRIYIGILSVLHRSEMNINMIFKEK